MRKLIALLATFVALFAVLGSTPASASTTTCQTDSNNTQSCITADPPVVGFASDQQTSQVSGVSTGTGGVAILVYTHFSFNESVALKHRGTCFYVKSAYNGGYWYGHKGFYYQLDHNLHVCKSTASPTGYIKIGGGITGADCHNPVKLISSPPAKQNILSKVQWSSTFLFRATVTVTAKATSTVRVSVSTHNADNSCQASASAYGTSSATATATATATASTSASATISAAASARSQTHQSASVKASADAQVRASSTAAAAAFCSPSSPPPPVNNAPSVAAQAQACVAPSGTNGVVTGTVSNPNNIADNAVITIGSQTTTVSVPAGGSTSFTLSGFAPGTYTGSATLQSAGKSASFQVTVAQCTPPQQTPPSITSMTTINDVHMGGTSPNFNVGTVVPLGHSGSLTCSAQYGSFTPSSVSVTGMSTSTFTYVAPDDPTATNGLTENVTCTVYDNVTGLSAMRSETFPIFPRPAPPA